MKDIGKIAACIVAVSVIIGTAYSLDGRWVLTRVYAQEKAVMQMRQLQYEERGIQKDIYDLEDRLANPRLPDTRKAVYRERLHILKMDLVEIQEEKEEIKKGSP